MCRNPSSSSIFFAYLEGHPQPLRGPLLVHGRPHDMTDAMCSCLDVKTSSLQRGVGLIWSCGHIPQTKPPCLPQFRAEAVCLIRESGKHMA